jgi:hypothetical protein
VPGWPDAPARARAFRSLPIVLPLLAVLALLGWRLALYSPEQHSRQQALAPLLALEREVSDLEIANSEQQIAQLAERAAGVSRLMVENPDALSPLLKELKAKARTAGWEATFQTVEAAEEPAEGSRSVSYLPVRARLKPLKTNAEPFASLLALLERFSTEEKRIDLTRLSIRADDTRWQAVELSLRLVTPALHAKTP